MSKEYPCVYHKNGECKKHSGNGVVSYCLLGPCPDEIPSNADRIRAMNDEELAEFWAPKEGCGKAPWCKPSGRTKCNKVPCYKCALEWLRQPAEGGDHNE